MVPVGAGSGPKGIREGVGNVPAYTFATDVTKGLAMAKLTGGCHCGDVRYECDGPIRPAGFCHCASCRRASGAPMMAWMVVASDGFAFTRGWPAAYHSSGQVTRTFCGRCGTGLTYAHAEDEGEIDVTIASLDTPGAVAPTAHTWMEDAVSWDRPDEVLPSFARRRSGGGGEG
jgi:hypothetical protein